MKLTSMKLPPRDKTVEEKMYPTMCDPDNQPEYPYGLCISLDDAQLDALGLKKLPAVGDAVTLNAQAKIVGVSESETQEGTRRSLSMQITDLAVE
jgi:hypothetical protein